MNEDALHYDVLIVGAGPAGLSCAIRLKNKAPHMRVCVLEKGAQVGSHILSGAVLDPRVFDDLTLFETKEALHQALHAAPVTEEDFCFLTQKKKYRVPDPILPRELKHTDHLIISLSHLCRVLAEKAEEKEVDIFPATSAKELLINESGCVIGVKTGEMGRDKNGQPRSQYQAGICLYAKHTLLAEGCRGYLSEKIIARHQLREDSAPPSYGLGVKELWEIGSSQHTPGRVQHFAGWPLKQRPYGGGFIYHLPDNKLAVGFVSALDYENPTFSPFEQLQRFKTHPAIYPLFKNARRLGYGARALNEGGFHSLPKLTFKGGALLGCAAGLLNVARIQGIHHAMESGVIAADAIHHDPDADELTHYDTQLQRSLTGQSLKTTRNFRHYFRYGLTLGTLLAGLDLKICRGKVPWNIAPKKEDRAHLRPLTKIPAPFVPDNIVTFDRLSSVYLSHVQHEENQPDHLIIQSEKVSLNRTLAYYGGPEQYYCPAHVYEWNTPNAGAPQLTIHAANCIHCKACDIKDPEDNIHWSLPEGGSGPNYTEM